MTGQALTGIPCFICGASSTFQAEDGEYTRCIHCGVIRTKYDYDPTLYGTKYAVNYLNYANSPSNNSLNLCRLGLASRWLYRTDCLLDVGCCVGEFLRYTERYFTCVGFEPNERAAIYARERCNSLIITKLDLKNYDPFGCITMFDVVEHLDRPKECLEYLCSHLRKHGTLVITTPNVAVIPKWADVKLRAWKHYKPKEHLFLHTEISLEGLLQSVGLSIVHVGTEESDIRPGNPDGDILTIVGRKL